MYCSLVHLSAITMAFHLGLVTAYIPNVHRSPRYNRTQTVSTRSKNITEIAQISTNATVPLSAVNGTTTNSTSSEVVPSKAPHTAGKKTTGKRTPMRTAKKRVGKETVEKKKEKETSGASSDTAEKEKTEKEKAEKEKAEKEKEEAEKEKEKEAKERAAASPIELVIADAIRAFLATDEGGKAILGSKDDDKDSQASTLAEESVPERQGSKYLEAARLSGPSGTAWLAEVAARRKRGNSTWRNRDRTNFVRAQETGSVTETASAIASSVSVGADESGLPRRRKSIGRAPKVQHYARQGDSL